MTGARPGGHRLVLMRHAKAEASNGISDELRPLALAGRRQSGDVGARLAASGLLPERVLVSSAVRTRQTWELVKASLGDLPDPEADIDDALYDAGPRDLLRMLAEVDERVATLLVIGHEPAMSMTAAMITDPRPPVGELASLRLGLPTAGVAVLEVTDWSAIGQGTCRLLEVWRPDR